MSLKVANSGPPIARPSSSLKNLLLNLKVHSIVRFMNILLKNHFPTNWRQIFINMNLFSSILIVSTIGIFVNNDSTSCNTSFSSSCKGRIENNILGNFVVSLMEYSLLHLGHK